MADKLDVTSEPTGPEDEGVYAPDPKPIEADQEGGAANPAGDPAAEVMGPNSPLPISTRSTSPRSQSRSISKARERPNRNPSPNRNPNRKRLRGSVPIRRSSGNRNRLRQPRTTSSKTSTPFAVIHRLPFAISCRACRTRKPSKSSTPFAPSSRHPLQRPRNPLQRKRRSQISRPLQPRPARPSTRCAVKP